MEQTRRFDIDWLRVIVFALLICYHVGMFFVPWGWHIKNNEIYPWLRIPMLFLNQWRLPILFVISGMGTAYALAYRTGGQFIKERFLRLYIPLAFGMLVIVSPQVYIERLVNNEFTGSILDWFASGTFMKGIYPAGNFSWNHLWFLPYLLVFSVMLTPIFIWMRSHPEGAFQQWIKRRLQANPYFLFSFILPLYGYEALLEPFFDVTHNLIWDWFNFVSSLTLFFYGFLLISVKEVFWQAVERIWKSALVAGIICFSGLLFIWFRMEDSIGVHFTEALLKVVNLWSWVIAIFGLAARYLNKSSNAIAYLNRAVYPFYILHQTMIILLAYFIYQEDWGLATKFGVLMVGTFGGCFLLYEFAIRRMKWTWILFGLKDRK